MSSIALYLTDVYDVAKRAEAIRWVRNLRRSLHTVDRESRRETEYEIDRLRAQYNL